jgi:hypothetical protein
MSHLANKPLVTKKEADGDTYTASVIVIDAADDHGLGVIAFRHMAFLSGGAELDITSAGGGGDSVIENYGATTTVSNFFQARYAFITSLARTGGTSEVAWISNSQPTNQRLWIRLTTPITFDSVVIYNYSDSGGVTTAGINNAVITITEDTNDPSSVYNAAVTDGVVIYDGVFREHVALDIPDPETLVLI